MGVSKGRNNVTGSVFNNALHYQKILFTVSKENE